MPILFNKSDPDAPNARFQKSSPLLIGAADDADLSLKARGVSGHHCWIERHHDGFHLVDLETTNGSFLNGKQVRDALLREGDIIRVGVAELEFRLTESERDELESSRSTEGEAMQLAKVEHEHPASSATTAVDFARRCPQCGAPRESGANFCSRCGLPSTAVARPLDQFVQPVEGPGVRGPGILPLLALICGLVGPLLLGIGWLLGIILGLMALGIIRRTGGFERDRRHALWGVGAGIAWAAIMFMAGGSWYLLRTAEERRARIEKQMAENEQAVLVKLANLARAQKYAKTILFADANHNLIGEYLKLEQMADLESPFVDLELARKGTANGYRFSIREASEERFVAIAEPQRAGRTGLRTFSVDQTGVLRGDELGGVTPSKPSLLPPLKLDNAFKEVDDEIAEDALAVARAVAKEGDYEKSRVILDGLRRNFTLTKAAKQLTDLQKTIDPFLIEARADQKYREALAAKQRGDMVLAIALLRDIEVNYPTFSKIHAATKELGELQVQYAQEQEERAKELFEKAEALEREGKVAEAESLYFQIEKKYPDTEWARKVLLVKPALQQELREKQVEGWLQQLANLSPESDYAQILNLVEQLHRNYADTDAYQSAFDSASELQSLRLIEQKALAQKLRVDAFKQAQAGQSRRALTTLEKAISETPDLAVYLRETLWDLYPRVAAQMRDEHDARGALSLYEKFLRLNPPENKLDRQLFADLSYQVGQSDLIAGHPDIALPRLQQAEAMYRSDPEFNTVYARTLSRLERFEDAIERYGAAAKSLEPDHPLRTTLFFWRAWAWLHWAEELEAKLRKEAELPTLAAVVRDMDRSRLERESGAASGGSATNQPAVTNLTISILQPAHPLAPTEESGITTNVFETLLGGSLELVADIEAARVDFSRQELTTRGKGDKAEISIRFEKAKRIQEFRDRVSRLRQLMLGEREHQRIVAEDLQRLLNAWRSAQEDLERAAKINEIRNAPLAANARLVIPSIAQRAELYRNIVPALVRIRRDDLQIAETSLELAEQAINQLQWNLKGGISISKTVEENFRRVGSRKALDEAIAAFHRFDDKRLDLAETWRRNSLPEP